MNPGMLKGAWTRLHYVPEPTPAAAPNSRHGAFAAVPNAPFGGPHGTSQVTYHGSYATPQPNFGGAFNAHQPDPWAQHATYQPPYGGPYASTTNPNLQLPPISSFDPFSSQNYNSTVPQAMAPGMQQPLTSARAGRGGGHQVAVPSQASYNQQQARYDRHYRFSQEQKEWILNQGMYISDEGFEGGLTENEFYMRFKAKFGDQVPSQGRVMKEFDEMRGSCSS